MSNLVLTDKCDVSLRVLVQELLEIEAERLGCSISEVMPFHQTPESVKGSEIMTSKFSDLPFDLFCKITQKLGLIDLHQLHCVCKKWRYLVFEILKEVQKIEYHFPTHLLRFRRWIMACSFSPVCSYQKASIKLTKWTAQHSLNLQILVVDSIFNWNDFVVVLDCCPGLRHLVLTVDDGQFTMKFQNERPVVFSKLKTFVLHQVANFSRLVDVVPTWIFHEELTIFSFTTNRVWGFDPTTYSQDQAQICPLVEFGSPGQSFFTLKYLRLDACSCSNREEKGNLAECLQNCPELLVCILEFPVIRMDQVLRSLHYCSKLQVLWILNGFFNRFRASDIKTFYNALHEVDPERSLKEFYIVVTKFQIKELEAVAPFNFIEQSCEATVPERFSVRSPYMKQTLNTPF